MAIVYMQPGLSFPRVIEESPSARRARLELALIVGGTLGAFAILILEVSGKRKLAQALTGAGILAGGFVGGWRVLEEEKLRVQSGGA
jgi:hypothetical protein